MGSIPAVRFPQRLRSGDPVALIAPGGAVSPEQVEVAVRTLGSRGLEVRVRDDIVVRHRYLAGDDARRSAELLEALTNPELRAVFLARGGYGSQRLLGGVAAAAAGEPRPVVGFSDNTALLNYLRAACGWAVLHGAHPTRDAVDDLDAVLGCLGLFGEPARPAALDLSLLNPGPWELIQAEVAGGCLSLLSSSAGTPYAFAAGGRIVFLEEVGEPVYRIDRMLHHLLAFGALEGAAAVVFGRLPDFLAAGEALGDLEDLLREFAARAPWPVLVGLPSGHTSPNLPLPFGPRALLDPARGTLAFVEAVVR